MGTSRRGPFPVARSDRDSGQYARHTRGDRVYAVALLLDYAGVAPATALADIDSV